MEGTCPALVHSLPSLSLSFSLGLSIQHVSPALSLLELVSLLRARAGAVTLYICYRSFRLSRGTRKADPLQPQRVARCRTTCIIIMSSKLQLVSQFSLSFVCCHASLESHLFLGALASKVLFCACV